MAQRGDPSDPSVPDIVDVCGRFDEAYQIEYLGDATRQPNGLHTVLANVKGALCLVEVSLRDLSQRERLDR